MSISTLCSPSLLPVLLSSPVLPASLCASFSLTSLLPVSFPSIARSSTTLPSPSVSFSVHVRKEGPHARTYPQFPLVPPIFHGEIRYRHFRVARISNDHSRGLRTGMQENVQKEIGPNEGSCEKSWEKEERERRGKVFRHSFCLPFFLAIFSSRSRLTGSVLPIAFLVPTC